LNMKLLVQNLLLSMNRLIQNRMLNMNMLIQNLLLDMNSLKKEAEKMKEFVNNEAVRHF
jgi:hypothetical protein